MVDARSTTVVAIGTVVVAGSAVVVGGTAAVDGTATLAGVVVVVRATVVVAGTAVVVGATVVVGTAFVVGVVVGAVLAVDVVVAVVVVDSAEVEVGAAVSELPPHPETTNKTVTATACALTFQVCHPFPEAGSSNTHRDWTSEGGGGVEELPPEGSDSRKIVCIGSPRRGVGVGRPPEPPGVDTRSGRKEGAWAPVRGVLDWVRVPEQRPRRRRRHRYLSPLLRLPLHRTDWLTIWSPRSSSIRPRATQRPVLDARNPGLSETFSNARFSLSRPTPSARNERHGLRSSPPVR